MQIAVDLQVESRLSLVGLLVRCRLLGVLFYWHASKIYVLHTLRLKFEI